MIDSTNKLLRSLRLRFSPNPLTGAAAVFLWGPRQTGKTTLLHDQWPRAKYYDLLDTQLATELRLRPALLREEVLGQRPPLVVVDEVQKAPELLEEVHWLLENSATHFVLCGSSARKLRRVAHNLLGGRAVDAYLFPLTSAEIGAVDLHKLLNHGALPTHYLAPDPGPLLRAYVRNYLREEILDESLTRNVPAFARFLEIAAIGHGQQINHTNMARETGVSASTVKSYYQILEDTLLGFRLEPWRKPGRRRLVGTPKFFLFDMGVARQLHPDLREVSEGSDVYGRAFEHFLINEVRACCAYRELDAPLYYWGTHGGDEVDLVVGDLDLALEFKSSTTVRQSDLKGLRALKRERAVKCALLVSRDPRLRRTEDGIELLDWRAFCARLWQGELPGLS